MGLNFAWDDIEQNRKAQAVGDSVLGAVEFTLWTEDNNNLEDISDRYFDGFTVNRRSVGSWKGSREHAAQVVIVGTNADFQRVLDLAGDIRVANGQHTVMVTWRPVGRLDVNEETIANGR